MITRDMAYQIGFDAADSRQYVDKHDARARALRGVAEMGAGAAFDAGWRDRRKEMNVDPAAIRGTW